MDAAALINPHLLAGHLVKLGCDFGRFGHAEDCRLGGRETKRGLWEGDRDQVSSRRTTAQRRCSAQHCERALR